ncbi:hypothetical protein CLV24_10516 [Pontibacter ummariensis]|uniref:Uncharacterized protein n=1 Tax=Pontibacter ummariensis TaxID=1610492 RepID=A0A239E155_9BACT|nr:hypothetical protein [Pontibacter ummariensis]PRY13646.1 hypothetical protein CLV24_10516 [Pontibacter ummariensis]SNS38450.1 hypothetical protein SAMN06296052_105235 [Pontibacter ummariensis]
MRNNFYWRLLGCCLATVALMSCEKEELANPDLVGLAAQQAVETGDYTIDFEQFTATNPEDLPFITEVTGAYGTVGVYNMRRTSGGEWQETNVARIYDAANPTGDDAHDLGQPEHLGKMLIANQYTEAEIAANPDGTDEGNGRIAGPNDNAWGARMELDFSSIEGDVTLNSIDVIDIDNNPIENRSYVQLVLTDDSTVDFEYLKMHEKEGAVETVNLNGTRGVKKLIVMFDGGEWNGSGAIDNISFSVERTTTPPPPTEPYGCTLTQGYWKNHASGKKYDTRWGGIEKDDFYNSDKTYLEVLKTAPKGGNAYYILAHQFIAAKLNMQGASSTPAVTEAFENAEDYFESHEPEDPYETVDRALLIEWAETLTAYNEGKIGPGHCEE